MGTMDIDDVLAQLASLYVRMDRAYAECADAIGLDCEGCPDSCCQTHFHHRTIVERLYLWRGLDALPSEVRSTLFDRARRYRTDVGQGQAGEDVAPRDCPLLEAGRCLLYEFRPMICRLHGVPWVLRRGRLAGEVQPGCEQAGRLLRKGETPPVLDRTTLYHELALLEQTARRLTGWTERLETTVADMIVGASPRDPSTGWPQGHVADTDGGGYNGGGPLA